MKVYHRPDTQKLKQLRNVYPDEVEARQDELDELTIEADDPYAVKYRRRKPARLPREAHRG